MFTQNVLEKAFHGSPMKTDTKLKVMGWLELVGTTLLIIGTLVSFVMLAVFFAQLGDTQVGRRQKERFNSLYNSSYSDDTNVTNSDEDQPQDHDEREDEDDDTLFMTIVDQLWLSMCSDIGDLSDERAGQIIKSRFVGFIGTVATSIIVVFILHCAVTALLMVGIHKKKPCFVLPWLVSAVLGFLAFNGLWFIIFPITDIAYLPFQLVLFYFVIVSFRLYFIFLTHRFWRENKTADLPMTLSVKKQTNWTSDEPLISMGLPEHCFEPKK